MSYFGDNREHMNRLYDDIGYFFCKGGSISEFFHVLNYFFEDYDSKKEEEKEG